MFRRAAHALLLLVSIPAFAATEGGAIPVPLPLMPPNNWWNTDITNAPVDPSSASYIAFINQLAAPSSQPLHPDWGGDVGNGTLYGFPYIIVDGSQPKVTVNFVYASESDGAGVPFYPIPPEAITTYGWIEEGPPGNVDNRSTNDRHMLIVDSTNNYLYELYNVFYDGSMWQAGSGAFWNMNTNNTRPLGWTSADAAGLQMLPGLVRYDEVYGPNEIGHAFRFTVRASNGYVYPASHVAGSTSGALPMGARLRLKASKDISSFPSDVQKIFRAMKKYGLIVADNGTDMYVSGSYDNRWDMGVMNTAFNQLTASDFDVVQLGWYPPTSLVISIPTTLGAGNAVSATVTAYDSSYNVATGYRGTVHFSSTDGSAVLPADYTFTSTDSGTHTFASGFTLFSPGGQTISATDTSNATIAGSRNVVVGPATPAGLVATSATTTSVNLSWGASSGAAQYQIVRASASSAYTPLTTTASTSYADNSVTAGNTYVYKVAAIDSSSRSSPFSAPDAATTILFTDDPLSAGSTTIKAVHINELRQAVNAMRAAAGLTAASFTDSSLTGVLVKAVHVQELRDALDPARSSLGLAALLYTDPTLAAGSTLVKAAHVQELRGGVK